MSGLGTIINTVAVIEHLAYAGSALIFCVGVNVGFGKCINVGNMLPALIVAAVWAII